MGEAEWKPIESCPPYRVVLLYRLGTLYPVVGSMIPGPLREGTCVEVESKRSYVLEEGGQEDDPARAYPFLREPAKPTHWAELPEIPLELLLEAERQRRGRALDRMREKRES